VFVIAMLIVDPCHKVVITLLNQARAGRRPARDWFFEIAFVRDVCMRVCVCVCVSAPEAINNQWRDMV